ncbi:MAG TPA: hypothetical protein VLB27_04400 [candidate division Zixibacteria bacterium]|nr:hypothetical protein [candidate division Zixibacteria bacterium]
MNSSLTAFSADFLRRSLRMTAALTLLGSLWVLLYWGAWPALGFLSASVWGLVNILFLSATVRAVLRPDGVDKLQAAGLLLIKFPLLYLAGYFLISFERFEVLFLLAGMSVFFVVVVLKALGRAVTKLDENPSSVKNESVLN